MESYPFSLPDLASLYRELMDDPARTAGPGELASDELDPTPDASPATGTDTFFTTTAGSDTTLTYQWSENANGMVLNIKGIWKGQEDGASLRSGVDSPPFDSFERRDRLNDREWEEGK
jgi:hypothetical protein